MHPETKKIRDVAKQIPDSWVRRVGDGLFWAGVSGHHPNATTALRELLERSGWTCEMKGKPGTAGEFIIDVCQNP